MTTKTDQPATVETGLSGYELINTPALNKGTVWMKERQPARSPGNGSVYRSLRIRFASILDNARLKRVLAYIEDQLAEEITVADLAGVASLSMFHFTRVFTARMGVPPHRYVRKRRHEAAKVVIARGRASLSEIAFTHGFSSQSSFPRAFKRATGMTPADYRRQVG